VPDDDRIRFVIGVADPVALSAASGDDRATSMSAASLAASASQLVRVTD